MSRVPYNKLALTYADQLQLLKDRGLQIEDDNKALHLLENISYYRLSAYWHPFFSEPKSAHLFKPNSSFNASFKLYCFDLELRKLIAGELEKIEISVRAKMIYILAHRYGPFWYNDPSLFSNRSKYRSSIQKLKLELGRSDEEFIRVFQSKYSNPLPPSWMILEISSFGNLSNFFSNLNPGREKREIANFFGLGDTTFESWLHSFTYVRNINAHHSRLWNKRMRIQPMIPLSPLNPFLSITTLPNLQRGGTPLRLNDRVYFMLSMIAYILNTINPNHTYREKLKDLFDKYPNVDKKAMGFPSAWEHEPIWDWNKINNFSMW